MTSAAPLLIVDGDNLTHRAYHTTPKTVRSPDGAPINAIVGFFSMLLPLWQRELPRAMFVAWDTLGVDTYRSKLWPDYQGGRVFEPELVAQLNTLPEICRISGFGVGKSAGHEADDIVASVVHEETRRGGTCLIYTTDKDSYQLVSESVTVLSPKKGSREPERIGPAEVVARFGVLPEQVADFKALCGDPSDRIPGAKGVGPKGAAGLLLRHATLKNVVESWANAEERARILMFREVVRMDATVPVELPKDPPNWTACAQALEALGAKGVAERIRSIA